MPKDTLVYNKSSNGIALDIDSPYQTRIWKPGIFRYLPPHKNIKYLAYWMFYMVGIFKNDNYSAYYMFENDVLVSSCMVIPSYFKWPFMGIDDVQFTYVMTSNDYRGKGVAGKLIKKIMSDLQPKVDTFWYVTDKKNIASIRVAEKMGFQLIGQADKSDIFKIIKLTPKNK